MGKFVIILFLLFVLGCGPEAERNERTFIIENTTNVSLNLKFFTILTDGARVIKLSNSGDTVLETAIQTAPFRNDDTVSYISGAFSADSIVVIFNNNSKLTYTYSAFDNLYSSPVERNIFRPTNYESIGNGNFLYKITQADFERSEPCEDNCD